MRRLSILCGLTLALGCGLSASAAEPALPVTPLPRAHAHNDYAHARPLLDALDCGFCSIEADVFLVDGQLLVAHSRSGLSPQRTLPALYLDPLRERARRHGGRVYPGGPVCLLFIDLKTEAEATYAALRRLLAAYPELVTRFEGDRVATNALTVIVTGNRPRATLAAESPRLAAYDGLLADLDNGVSPLLVPVVSEQWTRHFKWRGEGALPEPEMARLKEILAKAHAQGRRVRFWAAPDKPAAWGVLLGAGVDLINTDNLASLRDFLLRNP